jgi:uncharacterized protein YbbC (DUF1343 family)
MRCFFINRSKKLTAFFLLLLSLLFACTATDAINDEQVKVNKDSIILGAEQVTHYLPMLTGKKVGLVVNQTSQLNDKHLVDVLIAKKVNVQAIFAPEHGFRGDHDAGEKFSSSVDKKTGIPLISIYGKNRKPSAEVMAKLDVIIFDIQDVGVRFYTYISSMHYMMEAAADAGVSFIVFDRPNPNGAFVDGPILEPEFTSFVGMHKIPLLHGMTIAELALMFKGEGWLNSTNVLNLTVVSMKNYQRTMAYSLPIKPSPNLPNDIAINLYPSLGFFEATPVSIGRGTDFPFQVIGHDKLSIGDFEFMPVSTPGAATTPKLMNKSLKGQDLRQSDVKGIDLSFIINWHQVFKEKNTNFFTRANFMDKLSGTDKLRKAINAGKTQQEIKQSWQQGLRKFKTIKKPYLLYPDL